MKNLPILSIYQPSLNQCLISHKYYSEAIPEFGHLSIPPGFILNDFKNNIYYDTPISSTLSDVIVTKLVNNINPDSKIEIIQDYTEKDTTEKDITKKKVKKTKKKNNSKKKSKQTKKK